VKIKLKEWKELQLVQEKKGKVQEMNHGDGDDSVYFSVITRRTLGHVKGRKCVKSYF
jgi:hypothetical protein